MLFLTGTVIGNMRPPTSEASSGGDEDEVEDVVDYEPGLLLFIFHFYYILLHLSLYFTAFLFLLTYTFYISLYQFSEPKLHAFKTYTGIIGTF